MLNRRLIRIRAMQSLYAYEQSKKANFLIAQELIEGTFQPDLNSMDYQDKEKLEGFKKLGLQLIQEKFGIQEEEEDFDAPSEVQKIVDKASSEFLAKNRQDFDRLKLGTLKEADKVYEVYFLLLSLYIALANLAKGDPIKIGKSNLNSNKLLLELANNTEFEVQCLKRGISWKEKDPFVKELYSTVLIKNEKYLAYCQKLNHTEEEEIALLKYLIKNIFLKNDLSDGFFERYHLFWSEDKQTLRAMVAHTFQNYPEEKELNIAKPNEEWQERKDFLNTLFKNSVLNEKELMNYILPKLKNWKYDRIAETDKILMKLALVELMEFPSIPVKVTINEIIEIAKAYSTPKSGQFINGILDNLTKDLIKNGKIKKSGRGMLDNK